MKILASSIVDTAQAFLHSGYVSGYPRPFDPAQYPGAYPEQNPAQLKLDVAESLRLQGEQLAAAVTGSTDPTVAVAAVAGNPQWVSLLVGSACFAAIVAFGYLIGDRLKAGWRSRVPALAAAAAAVVVAACSGDASVETNPGGSGAPGTDPTTDPTTEPTAPAPLPTEVPWDGMELREYASPELATQVLLHGIIADAIINVGQPIESLANIQNEVGLPTTTLTEGEAYALQTYGIDGWGNEFRLVLASVEPYPGYGPQGLYHVTSAGEDGVFDTADDLSIAVDQTDDGEFDQSRHAWFLTEHAEQTYVAFHRWTGELFEYNNEAVALQVTGSELFDLFTMEDYYDELRTAIESSYQEMAAAVDYSPLVLEVYDNRY
jgi:hypothetical protein